MIEIPDWLDAQTWQDFEDMRRKLRKPLTDAARRLAIRKLESLYREYGHRPKDVLEQSILNGWQSLWPLCQGRRDRRDEEWRRELNAGNGPDGRGRVRKDYVAKREEVKP